MAAIDNAHQVEILSVNVNKGVSKKSGLPFEIHNAECVVRGPDGKVNVGVLRLDKALAEQTLPGKYLAEFVLDVSYDRLVVPRIVKLHPHAETAQLLKPTAKAAA